MTTTLLPSPRATSALGIGTLLRFLIGDREAILQIASERQSLWIGAIFVLAAGFAREYDQEDLLHSPWYLAIPFVASIALSFLMFLMVRDWRAERATRRPFWGEYRAFLSLFWMTAPLALLYGVPYERLLSPANAVTANLWTLALVASWRVALMVRASAVLEGRTFLGSFFLISSVAVVAAAIGLYFMPVPLINFMGGIELSAAELQLRSLHQMASIATFILFFICVPGGLIRLIVRGRTNPPILKAESAGQPIGLLLLAIAAVLIWTPMLPATQREQRLRSLVERQLESHDINAAFDELTRHSLSEFPPNWQPPPLIGWEVESPQLLAVMEVLADRNDVVPWVRAVYLDKFERKYLRQGWYWQERDFAPLLRLIQRLPEGPAMKQRNPEAIKFMLEELSTTRPSR